MGPLKSKCITLFCRGDQPSCYTLVLLGEGALQRGILWNLSDLNTKSLCINWYPELYQHIEYKTYVLNEGNGEKGLTARPVLQLGRLIFRAPTWLQHQKSPLESMTLCQNKNFL